jgi:putative transposase
VPNALESTVTHGPENTIHRRLSTPELICHELCEHYGISRKTGYKWIERYEHGGLANLAERSRRPHVYSTPTPEEEEQALTEARQRHPSWGAKKLLAFLSGRHPEGCWPARSTA